MNSSYLIITSLICFFALGIFILLWCRKHKDYFFPILIGAGAYFLFAIIGENTFRWIFIDNNQSLIDYVYNHRYLEPIILLSIIGIFEETARFVSFKTVLKKHNNKITAINYGIGHGGIEALYIVGINYVLMAIWMETSFQFPFCSYETIVPEMTVDGLPCALFERFLAIFFHIALSIFVFIASRDKKKIWIFPVCIVAHAISDVPSYLYMIHSIDLLTHDIIFLIEATIIFSISMKIYKKQNSILRA